MRNSFSQSSDMESSFHHLNDTFHSVWSLNAELLAKQLDRSALIVKMKEVVDNNNSLTEDVEVALQRGEKCLSINGVLCMTGILCGHISYQIELGSRC